MKRRTLLQGLAAASASLALPSVWIPRAAYAQTAGRGAVRHLVYIRLAGGFRFTTAFNGEVDGQFNPFGVSGSRANGTEWGASTLLERASWLDGDAGRARAQLGMRRVTEISNEICVLPCVDHEPFSARADGNHGTGLERFLTGYVGGGTAFLTYVNHGLKERVAQATAEGRTLLPAFSLGDAGMAIGAGEYAAFRPPVVEGNGFDRFGFDEEAGLPAWAQRIARATDERMRLRLNAQVRSPVEAYQQSRRDVASYGQILRSDVLRVSNGSTEQVDGISNAELRQIFGDGGAGARAALALRLFHFGCPAVFFNEGAYDMHSGEQNGLPGAIDEMNRLVSGLHAALKRMQHPEGGTYWERTLVVFGSEFGRTTGGQRFNSAGGSDHASDVATRWMSMPFMGGIVSAAGKGGRMLGRTSAGELRPLGKVYSYRAVLKTLLDWLGADHAGVFPADVPIGDFFA